MNFSMLDNNEMHEDQSGTKEYFTQNRSIDHNSCNKKTKQIVERQQTNSWNQQQDYNLIKAICLHGKQSWKKIAEYYNSITQQRYHRTDNQCWQRWTRVLSPKGHFSEWNSDEIQLLKQAIEENTINSYDVFTRLIPTKTKSQIHRMVRSIFVDMVRAEVFQELLQNEQLQ